MGPSSTKGLAMSRYKTNAAQARRREEVWAADAVECWGCGFLCEPTGAVYDPRGFREPVGICVGCSLAGRRGESADGLSVATGGAFAVVGTGGNCTALSADIVFADGREGVVLLTGEEYSAFVVDESHALVVGVCDEEDEIGVGELICDTVVDETDAAAFIASVLATHGAVFAV